MIHSEFTKANTFYVNLSLTTLWNVVRRKVLSQFLSEGGWMLDCAQGIKQALDYSIVVTCCCVHIWSTPLMNGGRKMDT